MYATSILRICILLDIKYLLQIKLFCNKKLFTCTKNLVILQPKYRKINQ